jgi:hypothetical protein
MIWSTQEDVSKLYSNTTLFYIRGLNICIFCTQGGLGTNPICMQVDNYTIYEHKCVHVNIKVF